MSEDDWRWHMYDTVKGSDWLGKSFCTCWWRMCLLKLNENCLIIYGPQSFWLTKRGGLLIRLHETPVACKTSRAYQASVKMFAGYCPRWSGCYPVHVSWGTSRCYWIGELWSTILKDRRREDLSKGIWWPESWLWQRWVRQLLSSS